MTAVPPEPHSSLIDPLFDLEPAPRVELNGNGWVDRRHGIYFSLAPDRDEARLWHFTLEKMREDRPLPLARCTLRRVMLDDDAQPRLVRYEVSRTALLSYVNRKPSSPFAARLEQRIEAFEPRYRDAVRAMAVNNRRLDVEQEEVRQFVTTLGGCDDFLELCCKAIRACHVRARPWIAVRRQSADAVEFVLLD